MIFNAKSMLLVTCLYIVNVYTAFGQQLPDLSNSSGYISLLQSNLQEEKNFSRQVFGEIGIDFYQVADPYVNEYEMMITEVNGFFEETGLSFYIGEIKNLPHSGYSSIKDTMTIYQVEALFSKENRISVFLIDSFMLDSIPGCGYSFFPDKPDHNSIFIIKNYFNAAELTRMLGHFFGLLNTHDSRGGLEMVSGQNCSSSGDFICDTPADGNILGQVVKCEYVGTKMSISGEFYIPSVANHMSEGPAHCRCIFTTEQQRRIKYYYSNYREYLH